MLSPLPPQLETLSLQCSFWPCDSVLRASPHALGRPSEGSASTVQQNQTQAKGVQRVPSNLSSSENIVTWPGNYRAARVQEPGPMSYFIRPLPNNFGLLCGQEVDFLVPWLSLWIWASLPERLSLDPSLHSGGGGVWVHASLTWQLLSRFRDFPSTCSGPWAPPNHT